MKNLKNSIIATILVTLCVGQHVQAEFAVVNKTQMTVNVMLHSLNGLVTKILKPNERWIVDASTRDNAKRIYFGDEVHVDNHNLTGGYIVAQTTFGVLKNSWKTVSLVERNGEYSIDIS